MGVRPGAVDFAAGPRTGRARTQPKTAPLTRPFLSQVMREWDASSESSWMAPVSCWETTPPKNASTDRGSLPAPLIHAEAPVAVTTNGRLDQALVEADRRVTR
jgi:hypothetical protein